MPRERNPNRDRAAEIWREHNGNIANRQIAEILGENEKVVAVWKQRDKWNVVQQTETKVVQQTKNRRHVAPKGNQYAKGNRGGPGGPAKNDKAVSHGLFRKFLPDDAETLEIYDNVGRMNPLDMLWENIQIKFTAIIRAQKIMFVRDRDDMTKEIKKKKQTSFGGEDGGSVDETEWEIQFAWDKQANFLNAQARAMTALTSMIKQYEELCRIGAADEEQRLRIDKLKLELAAINKNTIPDPVVFKDDLHE